MTIKKAEKGYDDRLICPYCKTRITALGISAKSKIYDVTVKCHKCKRILIINNS